MRNALVFRIEIWLMNHRQRFMILRSQCTLRITSWLFISQMTSFRLMCLLEWWSLLFYRFLMQMLLRYFMMLSIYLMSGMLLCRGIMRDSRLLLLGRFVNLMGDLRLE